MKYLKLFEDHKETTDKIVEVERNAQEQKDKIINEYKDLVDEMMYDITDDYETECLINNSECDNKSFNYRHYFREGTYLCYKIRFTADKYEHVLDKLIEITNRLKDAYDVSYNLIGVCGPTGDRLIVNGVASVISDLHEARMKIKNFLDLAPKSGGDKLLSIDITY